jgi:hypothetical protein
MFQEEFNKIITDPVNIMDIPLADVKGISERYPYCQIAQVMYAKKLRELNSPLFEQQLKKAAVAVFDRNVLYQYIEQPVTPQFVDAQLESKSKVLVEEVIPTAEIPETIDTSKVKDQYEPSVEITPENVVAEIPEVITPVVESVNLDVVEAIADETPLAHIQPEMEEMSEISISGAENEQILNDLIDSIPELEQPEIIDPVEPELLNNEQAEIAETTYLAEESVLQTNDSAVMDDEMTIEAEFMEMNTEEPIFELPGYDIEQELGTLAEEDMIKINITKTMSESTNDEVFEDSFLGWLNRLGSPSKGKIVAMKTANLPVKKYLQASPVAGKTVENSRQEKVMDEIIAGELARKSLQADEHLVTETYARILTMQGKYQKAVDMYLKLSLLKPQKSDYFAALIDQIKKRIK